MYGIRKYTTVIDQGVISRNVRVSHSGDGIVAAFFTEDNILDALTLRINSIAILEITHRGLLSRPACSTNLRTAASSFNKVAFRRAFRISNSFTVGLSAIIAREYQAQAGELIEAIDLQVLFQFPF